MNQRTEPEDYPREVAIPPEEDARLPIYEAIVDREWHQWRPGYVKMLKKEGKLEERIKDAALMCVRILQDCQRNGLNPDQGRELAQNYIVPQPES